MGRNSDSVKNPSKMQNFMENGEKIAISHHRKAAIIIIVATEPETASFMHLEFFAIFMQKINFSTLKALTYER